MADPRRCSYSILAMALSLGSAGCDTMGGSSSSTLLTSVPTGRSETPSDYHVVREDTLDVSVFMVPGLNRSVQVDADGRIDLPLLGKVDVGGHTTREIEEEISRRLAAKYVKNPQVTVAVKDALAQRFAVDGAVNRPGIYVAKGETTILQAIAQAGGPNDVGDIDDVTVVRVVDGRREATRYSLRAIRKGEAVDPQVKGKDSVIVGESMALNTMKYVQTLGGTALTAARFIP